MDVSVHRGLDACMAKKLLQDLRLYPTLDGSRCVRVPERMHTKMLDACLIAKLVEVRIIGTVFVRLSRAVIDKDQIPHDHAPPLTGPAVGIFQNFRQ